jgi:hypothetical protein
LALTITACHAETQQYWLEHMWFCFSNVAKVHLYGLMKLTSVMTPWSANSLPTSPMRLMFSSLHSKSQWA